MVPEYQDAVDSDDDSISYGGSDGEFVDEIPRRPEN